MHNYNESLWNKVVVRYEKGCSVSSISRELGISHNKCRKILIECGVFKSERFFEICQLMEKGMAVEEIAKELQVGEKTLNNYVPYSKGMYRSDHPTRNALQLREWHKMKKNNSRQSKQM